MPATETSPQGLSTSEAAYRLAQYGFNEVPERQPRPLPQVLSYFWGPVPWMIEGAVIVSGLLRSWGNAIILLSLLVATAAVRFFEESHAHRLIQALKARLAPRARVRRDGVWLTIPARDVVPGDLIHLRMGDIVPADAKLLADQALEVDQSTLTGESLAVTRTQGDTVFAGSIVERGESDAHVTATGTRAYFGHAARLIEGLHPTSHLHRTILIVGNYLTWMGVTVAAAILFHELSQGYIRQEWETALQFALMVVVAAIPADMRTILAITVAAGARRIARKEAVVSRLDSVEELARMDVLCADKTGTLTQNQLTVGIPFAVTGVQPEWVLLQAALASHDQNSDAIDRAITQALGDERALAEFTVTHFQPFDPARKRSEATVKDARGQTFAVTKGAVQIILALCADADQVRAEVSRAVDAFAARGFRAVAVARAEVGQPWRFSGVIPLFDPLRDDARATLSAIQAQGVDVKMITGDQAPIAREIARAAGLGPRILDATVMDVCRREPASGGAKVIAHANGFAQVFPEQKYALVEMLQAAGHTVGMTGDGVNDVPALKRAHAGIAVSGATDAARMAADIVLLAPGISGITNVITMSREMIERMRTYVVYHSAETTRTVIFLGVMVLVLNVYPLTPLMLALMSVLNGVVLVAIAYDRSHASSAPTVWNMPVLLGVAAVLGIAGVAASLGIYLLAAYATTLHNGNFVLARAALPSVVFLSLSLAGHLTIFVVRVRGPIWSARPGWALVVGVAAIQVVAALIAIYGLFGLVAPIGWTWALVIWAYDLAWLLVEDSLKVAAYAVFGRLWPDA